MTSPILRLSAEELRSALDGIDPIEVLAEELIGKTVDRTEWDRRQVGRLTPWRDASGAPASDQVLVEDLRSGSKCLLPASSLRMVRAAGLTALTARELLTRGVVTAAVLGSGPATQLQLTLNTRYVPDISHIAIATWSTGDGGTPVEPEVLDELELAGIGLSISDSVEEAVFGANLVIVVGGRPEGLELGHLARGALLINTEGRDLPHDLVNGVDQIYVDDAALLEANPERYFVKMHLAASGNSDWPRPHNGSHHRRHIDADLGQVLTGARPGRRNIDDILLVELLSVHVLDVWLACRLHRAARERGLGARLLE